MLFIFRIIRRPLGFLYVNSVVRVLQGLFLFCFSFSAIGQIEVRFSDPDLELINGKLQISYNILNSKSNERFSVWIEVTDVNGDVIKARTLSGDFGDYVSGGGGKIILWNLIADEVSDGQGIYVQLIGEKFNPKESTVQISSISRMGAVLRSAAFPGWGLSKIHPGNPHWIKGVAGYGCLAGSVIYNQKAATSYQNYLDSYDSEERITFFNNSEAENTISSIFAYAALGIWLTDIVWTILDSGELSHNTSVSRIEGFSIGSDFEKSTGAPMLSFRYKF